MKSEKKKMLTEGNGSSDNEDVESGEKRGGPCGAMACKRCNVIVVIGIVIGLLGLVAFFLVERSSILQALGQKNTSKCNTPVLQFEVPGSPSPGNPSPNKPKWNTSVHTYATDPQGKPLQLMVYRPGNVVADAATPLLMFFAGSAFAGTIDKGFDIGPAELFLTYGWSVAACPYQGYEAANGAALFPTPVHEAVAMVRYLRGNANSLGIAPSRIAALGLSSGGYYAGMLAASGSPKFAEAGLLGKMGSPDQLSEPSTLCAMAGFYGCYDLIGQKDSLNIPVQYAGFYRFLPSDMRNDKGYVNASVYSASTSFTYLDANSPPVFAGHGRKDTVVPYTQTTGLVKTMDALNIDTIENLISSAGHNFLNNAEKGANEAGLLANVLYFLNEHCSER